MLHKIVVAMGVVLFVLFVFCGGGCATIINGTTQEVAVSSDPPGAAVDIDGQQQLTTPFSAELERKRDHVLTFTMPGYETQQVVLNHTVSGAVAGNILAGGLIGWGVDAASGAQYKLVPDTVAVSLRPEGYAYAPAMPSQPLPYAPQANTYQASTSETEWLVESTNTDEVEAKLAQLNRLHTEGKITDAEWQRARNAVIGSLSGSY